MKSDKNIFLLKIALVVIILIIFANQLGSRDAVGLAGVLSMIPLVFLVDMLGHLMKRKISNMLELAYLFFLLLSAIIGTGLMVYNMGPVYDKVVHVFSGVLTVFAVREFWGKEIAKQRPLIKFMFYVGIAALIAVTWEIYEFTIDQTLGTDMQRVIDWGVADTMIDMIGALVGAVGAWIFLNWTKKI
ncbi:hypothetical protein FWG95_02580 [Candidatus Saccharibacteria bacterium]|nr:hypothetical protein [Candidatus Saccharibacteria bacterium]